MCILEREQLGVGCRVAHASIVTIPLAPCLVVTIDQLCHVSADADVITHRSNSRPSASLLLVLLVWIDALS